jgi:hypothetical protein
MSNYGSGMGMIFTNSGKQASRTIQHAPIQHAPIHAQPRNFAPGMNLRNGGGGGFRTMDLGNLKNSKSCGSCGH